MLTLPANTQRPLCEGLGQYYSMADRLSSEEDKESSSENRRGESGAGG